MPDDSPPSPHEPLVSDTYYDGLVDGAMLTLYPPDPDKPHGTLFGRRYRVHVEWLDPLPGWDAAGGERWRRRVQSLLDRCNGRGNRAVYREFAVRAPDPVTQALADLEVLRRTLRGITFPVPQSIEPRNLADHVLQLLLDEVSRAIRSSAAGIDAGHRILRERTLSGETSRG